MSLDLFIIRILTSVLTGFIIGFERQWNHKSAGLRTNTLASVGSAVFVLLSFYITAGSGGDVTRIIAQVVTGIGFIGAGIIFKEGFNVRGLTTAVTIWCSSAIGCFAGAGFLKEAITASMIVVLVNVVLKPLDTWLSNRK
ncbi:MAG: MgtC/SapB family protein [Bacteroidia bacterium]|nr:MgtC/SapB family protein [Bacteroidia bacterium]